MEFEVHLGERDVARGELEVRGDGDDDLPEVGRLLRDECVGARALVLRVGLAEVVGGVGLRVEVDEEHPLTRPRQARRQVDGRRRLADAAFLVGYRDGDDGDTLLPGALTSRRFYQPWICPRVCRRCVSRPISDPRP